MSFSAAFLEKIKSSIKISDLASRHVNWDQKKSNHSKQDFWAPCPFHKEKTASFHVDDAKGFYYCFGCQAKGNVFNFLKEMEGLSFVDAVKLLSEKAGIPLETDDHSKKENRSSEEQMIIDINEAASKFFIKNLFSAKGSTALTYLKDRGLSLDIIKEFKLGFSPSKSNSLINFLTSEGYTEQSIEQAGLAFRPEKKPLVDRFRNRVMFPILNLQNRVVAFGGRLLNTSFGAKYINSSETKVFKKGSQLFNLLNAKQLRKNRPLVVVEGYMDVISLANSSIDYAVAPLGTALTKDQLLLLWNFCEEPILLLDGDHAGRLAASRVIDLALPLISHNKTLRIANLPLNYDPDDFLNQKGKEALFDLIENSQTLIEFIFSNEKSQKNLDSPERLTRFHFELKNKLQKITDTNLKKMFLFEIEKKIKATHYDNISNFSSIKKATIPKNKNTVQKNTQSSIQASEREIEKLEAEIIFCLAKNPEIIKELKDKLIEIDFKNQFFKKSFWQIKHEDKPSTEISLDQIVHQSLQKNPNLGHHLVYNDRKKIEMSKKLINNRVTTLNLAKNRLESLKDLKFKIKTQGNDSSEAGESFEIVQNEYHRAIRGTQFVEDSIFREREFDKESLDLFSKKIKKGPPG